MCLSYLGHLCLNLLYTDIQDHSQSHPTSATNMYLISA